MARGASAGGTAGDGGTEAIRRTARALADRARTWRPEARLLGNLRADALAELGRAIADLSPAGSAGTLPRRHAETAAALLRCAAAWTPDARIVEWSEECGLPDPADGVRAGDLVEMAAHALGPPVEGR